MADSSGAAFSRRLTLRNRADPAQEELQQELSLGTAPRPAVREGALVPVASSSAYSRPFAELRIPRFGPDWEWAVVISTGSPSRRIVEEPWIVAADAHHVLDPLPGASSP